jgi:hypothetical protein
MEHPGKTVSTRARVSLVSEAAPTRMLLTLLKSKFLTTAGIERMAAIRDGI